MKELQINIASPPGVRALYLLLPTPFEIIYGPEERKAIDKCLGASAAFLSPDAFQSSQTIWHGIEFLFSGWGMVQINDNFLKRFPDLRAIFYGAGSVKSFVTEAFWDRDIVLTSAVTVNAIPVAEFTVSQIIYALKRGWQHAINVRKNRRFERLPVPGAYQSTVGLIALGEIGKRVAKLLRGFDLRVIAVDPFFPRRMADDLGVELVSLEELFTVSDVVSCHAPLLPETERMIRGTHFDSMRKNATFINTARGELIDEKEMVKVLRSRQDLFAVLDVTHPEPPPKDSPLYNLENIVMTPHIAGSHGGETRRMGNFMVQEFDRYLRGEALVGQITREMVNRMA